MAKVISLNHYLNQRQNQKNSFQPSPRPIWFSHIRDAIHTLALKDQEVIYRNIRYHYYDDYLVYVHQMGFQDNSYNFQQYLLDKLILNQPFKIVHGVDFSGAYQINRLSKSDWENIADMIVRIGLGHYLKAEDFLVNTQEMARQYHWNQVLVDSD